MFRSYFMVTMGLLGQEYQRNELVSALRDLRELIQVGGFAPVLYGVTNAGETRAFVPADRTWSPPAVHPLGAQAAAKPFSEQMAEQAAARAAQQ